MTVGRDALCRRIGEFRRLTPGCTARLTAPIEHHHDAFPVLGRCRSSGRNGVSPALDLGQIDDEGRIVRITTFFEPDEPT